MAQIQAIRGMKDLLPEDTRVWQLIETNIKALMGRYGYDEIRMPVLEKTDLFKRTIGEVTDIVEKEMYTFDDKNGDSLTLRPEGTAQCVRAGIEHGLLHNQTPRLWYYGPMFRHERPQKGRYRQFYQLGVEAFGMNTPAVDVEQILMVRDLFTSFGLQDDIRLELNTLGTPECRARYREALVSYLTEHHEKLDDDSKRRLKTNPLRVLDSKNPELKSIIADAPVMLDYLSESSKAHFDTVLALLDKAGVPYQVNAQLVRGLDYYTHTVFEFITDALGAQGTVCGGGRYDGLVEMIGGKATSAVGFAMGIERLIALLVDKGLVSEPHVDAYLVTMGDKAQSNSVILADKLRQALPHCRLLAQLEPGSAKSQFKKADKCGAAWAFIIGDDEMEASKVTIKPLRGQGEQKTVSMDALLTTFDDMNKGN